VSIFAGLTCKLPIPHVPDAWIEVRTLSWKQIARAEEARTLSVLKHAKVMGPDIIAASFERADRADVAKAANDPLNDYDHETLLKESIIGWSFADRPVTPENIDALDEQTKEWLVRELVALIKPPTGEALKNS